MSSALSMEGRGRVVLSARIVEDLVEIVIEDSGPGWPPELLRLCLTDVIDESPRHSGLGLLICARTCKRYGGTMTLTKSALGGAAAILKVPNPATSAAVQ